MSVEGKAVEFKNILSKGIEAFAEIDRKIELEKDKDKPKLARVLTILMNSFGAMDKKDRREERRDGKGEAKEGKEAKEKDRNKAVVEYVESVLKAERGAIATIAARECPQVGDRSVCYNANHVLAIALSIAYLKVKER